MTSCFEFCSLQWLEKKWVFCICFWHRYSFFVELLINGLCEFSWDLRSCVLHCCVLIIYVQYIHPLSWTEYFSSILNFYMMVLFQFLGDRILQTGSVGLMSMAFPFVFILSEDFKLVECTCIATRLFLHLLLFFSPALSTKYLSITPWVAAPNIKTHPWDSYDIVLFFWMGGWGSIAVLILLHNFIIMKMFYVSGSDSKNLTFDFQFFSGTFISLDLF